jgi:hypothetical protein
MAAAISLDAMAVVLSGLRSSPPEPGFEASDDAVPSFNDPSGLKDGSVAAPEAVPLIGRVARTYPEVFGV